MSMSSNLSETPLRVPDNIRKFREELDSYYQEMKTFDPYDLADIFLKLASWSARVSEIRGLLYRMDNRVNTAFRTREIDPFLNEVDRQFRTYSRIEAIRQAEYKMMGKL